MPNHIHFAAHVDHPIAHTSNIGRISLGLGAAALAAIVIVSTGGGAAILAFAAAGTIASAGSLGITAGSLIDSFIAPPVNECFVKSGLDSVRLGPAARPAARADHDDTKTRGWHTDKLAEGSRIVLLGPETRPMSRVADRADSGCGGKISDGLRSLLVGGEPSRHGQAIEEQQSTALWAIALAFDLVGAGATARKGGLDIVRGGADAVGALVGGDTQTALGMTTLTRPQNALDALGAGDRIFKGGQTALDYIR